MQVKDVMTTSPECCTAETGLQEVAQMMVDCDCGCIPVVDDHDSKMPVGMITDRDIVIRVIAEHKDGFTPVSDAMTEGVESCLEDDDIGEAARRMAELQMRRLVVFNGEGKLSGIISLGDIAIEHQGDLATEALEEISQDA